MKICADSFLTVYENVCSRKLMDQVNNPIQFTVQ